MSDVRTLGPYGEGGESPPIRVDLTRIDIRRGTIYLPRRFYGALPEGELEAVDLAAGRSLTVVSQPPRELAGLGPFFEEHDLRPNDALTLRLGDELQLMPVRRDRRTAPQPSSQEARAAAPDRRQSGSPGQEYQLPASQPAEAPRRQPDETSAPRSDSRDDRRDTRSGWQDVLHDPTPRRVEREITEPDPGKVRDASPTEREVPELPTGKRREGPQHDEREVSSRRREAAPESRSDSRPPPDPRPGDRPMPAPLSEAPFDPVNGEDWHEMPRDLSRPFVEERAASEPTEPEGHVPDARQRRQAHRARREEPRRGPHVRSESASGGKRDARRQQDDQEARKEERGLPLAPPPDPAQESLFGKPETVEREHHEEEREAVTVGAPAGDAVAEVARYLKDPATPAIVRVGAVAETLGLPMDVTRRAMASVSRESEGSVAAIRTDVYLVKRQR